MDKCIILEHGQDLLVGGPAGVEPTSDYERQPKEHLTLFSAYTEQAPHSLGCSLHGFGF